MSKGKATSLDICGKTICIGDSLKVQYTTGKRFLGATIKGEVIELWSPVLDGHLQGRLSNGWCFHDHDKIVSHIKRKG